MSEIDLQTTSNFHQMPRGIKTADAADFFGTFGAIFPCTAGLLNFFSDLRDRTISANFHIFEKTQNPPLATACRFDSGYRHHVAASFLS
ncbi:MAG: hypothetical protein IKT07_03785, partial [Oscillospiraceae bacterium]|nr:hypothetical protein [Oscillospiraceae bacterium]